MPGFLIRATDWVEDNKSTLMLVFGSGVVSGSMATWMNLNRLDSWVLGAGVLMYGYGIRGKR